MKSGVLLIDKEVGITSRGAVNFLMKKFSEKKIGHVGTLDPFADGLLIVIIGKATKISNYLENTDKEYLATLKLGIATDSGDLTGNEITRSNIPNITKEDIKKVFNSLLGKQKQIPPMYSAIKVKGKELYKYARNGEEVIRKEREIVVHSLSLISFEKDIIVFHAKVSKGTYIRTLGEDIAKRLNTVGHLINLTRSKVGGFSLEKAVKKEDASEDNIIDIVDALPNMKKHIVKDNELKQILNGMTIRLNELDNEVLCVYNNEAIAIYLRLENGYYKCERGLR